MTVRNGVFHGDLAALYARAKVVLNIHYTPLRNFECRVIEALGCGAFLLTEGLDPDDLLLDGEHLVVFNEENVQDLLGRYLDDPRERERIARAGHEAVGKYDVANQAERILDVPGRSSRPTPPTGWWPASGRRWGRPSSTTRRSSATWSGLCTSSPTRPPCTTPSAPCWPTGIALNGPPGKPWFKIIENSFDSLDEDTGLMLTQQRGIRNFSLPNAGGTQGTLLERVFAQGLWEFGTLPPSPPLPAARNLPDA